jgi:hypothetical protein
LSYCYAFFVLFLEKKPAFMEFELVYFSLNFRLLKNHCENTRNTVGCYSQNLLSKANGRNILLRSNQAFNLSGVNEAKHYQLFTSRYPRKWLVWIRNNEIQLYFSFVIAEVYLSEIKHIWNKNNILNCNLTYKIVGFFFYWSSDLTLKQDYMNMRLLI